MPYTSNRREVEGRFRRAVAGGLSAAARRYGNAVQRRLRLGFTTGAFKTGTLAASIMTVPATPENMTAYVGTSSLAQVDYAIYWELGHVNLFLRRWVRVPVWEPMLDGTRPEQESAFNQAFGRLWGGLPGAVR